MHLCLVLKLYKYINYNKEFVHKKVKETTYNNNKIIFEKCYVSKGTKSLQMFYGRVSTNFNGPAKILLHLNTFRITFL